MNLSLGMFLRPQLQGGENLDRSGPSMMLVNFFSFELHNHRIGTYGIRSSNRSDCSGEGSEAKEAMPDRASDGTVEEESNIEFEFPYALRHLGGSLRCDAEAVTRLVSLIHSIHVDLCEGEQEFLTSSTKVPIVIGNCKTMKFMIGYC